MRKTGIVLVTVIMMSVIMFPCIVCRAASCGEIVSSDTVQTLKAVNYNTDEKVASLLAPSRYSMADKLNKKLEISKRDGRNITEISDDEAVKELNRDNVKVMSFEEAFAEIQGEIGEIIQRVVDGTAGAQEKGTTYFTQKILQNKEQLLLGLTYLERLYDFNMGERNIRDILIYETDSYGKQVDTLDWLIRIGGAGGDSLKVSNNTGMFGWQKVFSDITTSMTLGAFLEENRQKWIPDTPMDEWFLQASRADIVENHSSWEQTNAGLYSRMYEDGTLRSHILPLLTVSEDSVYVIANSATITYGIVDCYVDRELRDTNPALYGEKREQFRQQLVKIAGQQKEFIDLWQRIAQPEVRGKLSSNRIVMDSLRLYADTTVNASAEWSDKYGEDASRGVREFFTPLNLYESFFFADGMASGSNIHYYLSKALTERGLATYAHELTHILVSSVMLNEHGSRDGMQAEVYTRGMFEPYELNDPPAFNLNLIYDRQESSERYHNASPGRFQDETDLQTYMSGILDVIYTLDYAEADAILAKTPEEKKKWFHKLEQIEDTASRSNHGAEGSRHNLDSVRELTLDEAEKLNTIDDLIRDNIIVSRYEVNGTNTTGTMASNGYYVVPLFSANYAAVQNDYGVSGDVMIRRQAFELLAEYGYYGGMVPYISNQYQSDAAEEGVLLSDTYILNKIFGGTYETMADFKRAMFQKRIDKLDELKPVTISWKDESVTIHDFETLQLLMNEAVESDLANVQVMPNGYNNIRAQKTQVERLKAELFRAYLEQTEDFEKSVYGKDEKPVEPTETPSVQPTQVPTETPTITPLPTETPATTPLSTEIPTMTPLPTATPTTKPTEIPTNIPEPTADTTATPGISTEGSKPTAGTTASPAALPSAIPTIVPTASPGADTTMEPAATPRLLFGRVTSGKKQQIIRWNSVGGADGYMIYGAKSGGKYKCLRTVGKKVLRWKRVGLKKGTQYQYYVAAYRMMDGKRVICSKSLPVYGVTKGGKYGNPVRIRSKRSSVSVKSGAKVRLKVKISGKKLKKASRKIRYISTEPSIANVTKKGTVMGVSRGTCDIYCVAWNGLLKKVNVSVK